MRTPLQWSFGLRDSPDSHINSEHDVANHKKVNVGKYVPDLIYSSKDCRRHENHRKNHLSMSVADLLKISGLKVDQLIRCEHSHRTIKDDQK